MSRGRPKTTHTATGKICPRCNRDLPLTEYTKRLNRLTAYCKKCDVDRVLDKLTDEEIKNRITGHRNAIIRLVSYLQTRNTTHQPKEVTP